MVNHVAYGIQAFLNGIIHLVVHGPEEISHLLRLYQVRSTLQAHGKAVQSRPPGLASSVILDTVLRETGRNGTGNRRIQAAAQQHTVRHVRHKLAFHSPDKGLPEFRDIGLIVLHGVIVEPVAAIPAHHTAVPAPPVMARQERLIFLAEAFEGLQFAGHVNRAVRIASYI